MPSSATRFAAYDKSAIGDSDQRAEKSALEGESKDQIEQKTNALGQVAMKLGEAMISAESGQRRRRPAPVRSWSARKSDDGVVDADFEEVKDDDRKSA